MPKITTVTLDPKTLAITVDNVGYEGKGCGDVTAAFAKGNQVKKDIHKPEWKQEKKNQVCQ